jgi:hypothetical protein
MVVFAYVTDFSTSITEALQCRGIAVRHISQPCDAPPSGFPSRVDGDVGSIIFALDGDLVRFLFDKVRGSASRRRLSAYEAAVCNAAVAATFANGACGVLVAVDGRRLTLEQKARTRRWGRELLHRIAYECAVNGVTDLKTAYGIIDTDHCIERMADAILAWNVGARQPSSWNRGHLVGSKVPAGY